MDHVKLLLLYSLITSRETWYWASALGRFSGRAEIQPRQLNNRECLISERTRAKKIANEYKSLTKMIYK